MTSSGKRLFFLDLPDRKQPPAAAPEREMLDGWLDYHRATILAKTQDVDDEALRRPGVPSGTSLLGLVKHLALAEHHWFGWAFAGTCGTEGVTDACDCGLPFPNGPGGWTTEGESVDDIREMYR